jgi:hydrogenase maturation protease
MTPTKARCLILACGNALRGDDGTGPWLVKWAEEKFRENPTIRVIARQQWTPDLAEDIAHAESVLFIDCSVESAPGSVRLIEVFPSAPARGLATHHIGAPELLVLARELYDSVPGNALLLTIGAGSTELGEDFSGPVTASLPRACALLEQTVTRLLSSRGKSEIPCMN